jgi:hypothetical protein
VQKNSSKRASVIVPFAAQRFLSSAVGQWKSIEKSFPVLRKSFQATHSNADEDFPLQYRMFGQDFVVDLLGLLDITAPLCELMVLSQSVDFLHGKIVFWGQRMLSWMEAIVENPTGTPRYEKHLQDLKNYLFQEVQLFEGWHLLSNDRMVHPDYNDEPMYTCKLNVLLPQIGNNTDNLVEGIARKYLDSHNSPMLRDPRSIRNYFRRNNQSKVIHRIKNMPPKYPYLL